MSAPTFTTGYEPTATDLQFLVPLYASCSLAQSVISQTTLTDSTYLQVNVAANTSYMVSAMIIADSATAAGYRQAFAGPTGASLDWNGGSPEGGTQIAATINCEPRIITDFNNCVAFGVGTSFVARPMGRLIVAGTAGVFKYQFCQSTSTASNTTLHANSFMILIPVA